MKKEKAKELSDILLAYSQGKTIQFSKIGTDDWCDFDEDVFASYYKYRVKSEPKLVPFTFEDNKLFRDKWIKIKDKIYPKRIVNIMSNGVVIFETDHHGDFIRLSYEKLLSDYEFEDGSPCGKYIE
jgi:hypothetical protein